METVIHTASISSTAIKSKCGRFRYELKRVWNSNAEIGAFLCANPSKADQLLYDVTVFKCSNLAVQWGWGGFYLLNLYPHYSTDPHGVERSIETDDWNTKHVSEVIQQVKKVVLACGKGHDTRLNQLIAGVPRNKLFCIKKNKGGGFLHPSRISPERYATPLPAYEEAPKPNFVLHTDVHAAHGHQCT